MTWSTRERQLCLAGDRVAIVAHGEGQALREVGRLFSRARGAELSIVVGTQELADLEAVLGALCSAGIRDRILGNLDVLSSHRQVVPESAETVAAIAGTRGAWITTHQTGNGIGAMRTGLGSRTRGREYRIHPDEIKTLGVGEAAVIVPRLHVNLNVPTKPRLDA